MNIKDFIKQGYQLEAKATEGPWDYLERELDGVLHTFVSSRPTGRVIHKGTMVPRSDCVDFYRSNDKLRVFMRNNFKTMLKALELYEECVDWYEVQEPDYAGVNRDGSPTCVMRSRYDNGEKARQTQKQIKELLNKGENNEETN